MTAASLQPKLASVLSCLAVDYLVCCHKHYQKGLQVKRFTDNKDWIPKSARNNFDLKGSKLVEQDEEYTTLVAESQDLIDTFRKDLRGKIFAATKLEVKKMKQQMSDTLASNLQKAIRACLVCTSNKDARTVDLNKFAHTFLRVYGNKIIVHLDTTLEIFLDTFKRVHTLPTLPTPFLTALPLDNLPGVVTADGSIFVPLQWLLELLTTLWRTIEPLFVTPFAKYLDTVNRANIELELQQLSEEFFNQKLTDDTAMLVDAEPPLDPQIMKDVVKKEVASATKSLKAEIASLKK